MPNPPFDVIVQGGAIVVLVLWVWDLRKQRDELMARLNRFTDALERSLERAGPPK